MDIALGISMAPTAVRMTLVEGENADGVTIEEDGFDIAPDTAATSAVDQVISAILGTREGAAEGGYQLSSTGVTWTDPAAAAALRDALAARKINNVMLVSAFLAAAALAQAVASAVDYTQIALLYVEPETATLAVVDADDGSVAEVHKRALHSADVTSELTTMIAELDWWQTRPEGLFVVGCGVDVAPIKPALEATTGLPVSVPEEPDTALARGAALASATAPLFVSSTAALAYAQDPGTGEVNPFLLAPGYFEVTADPAGAEPLAYSAVDDQDADQEADQEADEEADATVTALSPAAADTARGRRPLLMMGSVLAVVLAIGALATVMSLAVTFRQTVALQPMPGQHLIVPAQQAPAPPPAAGASAPHPSAVHLPAPAAAPAVDHPAPLPSPVHLPGPVSAVPALPAPVHPAPMPVLAPVPIPLPVPLAAPVQAPALRPPVILPIVPKPPVQAPTPLVHTPAPLPLPATPVPAHLFTPPAHAPTPPAHLPLPATPAPAHLFTPPAPAPLRLAPPAPIRLPAPAPMRLPAPAMPHFGAPPMRAPMMPRMPAMPMPRFNFRIPAFRL